jgi:hypothetical protein
MTSPTPARKAIQKERSAATRSVDQNQGQFLSPDDAAFVERHSVIATANELRPSLYRARDGRFLVVPTIDSGNPVTDTDGIRTQTMKAFTPDYDSCSPVDPADLSFADSVRAFGAYKKAVKVSTGHVDSLLSTVSDQVKAEDLNAKAPRPNAETNAKRFVTAFYKARVSPELMSLTNSIHRAAQEQEHVDPKAAEDFLSEIMTLEPKCYDEFIHQWLDFKRVRQVDQHTFELIMAGKKRSDRSIGMASHRQKR